MRGWISACLSELPPGLSRFSSFQSEPFVTGGLRSSAALRGFAHETCTLGVHITPQFCGNDEGQGGHTLVRAMPAWHTLFAGAEVPVHAAEEVEHLDDRDPHAQLLRKRRSSMPADDAAADDDEFIGKFVQRVAACPIGAQSTPEWEDEGSSRCTAAGCRAARSRTRRVVIHISWPVPLTSTTLRVFVSFFITFAHHLRLRAIPSSNDFTTLTPWLFEVHRRPVVFCR